MGCANSSHPEQAFPGPVAALQDVVPGAPVTCDSIGSFHKEYIVTKRLGKGAFAQVHEVERISTGESLAAKVILARGKDSPSRKAAKTEAHILKSLNNACQHCVGFVESFIDDDLCYIIMEKCDYTLLKSLENSDLTELTVQRVLKDMLTSVAFIHSIGIAHRDIKPDNFLCCRNEESVPDTVKLCDFGLAIEFQTSGAGGSSARGSPNSRTGQSKMKGVYGTAPFMSPEMLAGKYDEKTDVWSVGVLAYVLLLGQFPYMPTDASSKAMKETIAGGVPAPSFKPLIQILNPSDHAVSFLQALLERKPRNRPSAQESLEHSFISTGFNQEDWWGTHSLRPMLHAAKKIGAFDVRAHRGQTQVDVLIAEMQSEYHQGAERRIEEQSLSPKQMKVKEGGTRKMGCNSLSASKGSMTTAASSTRSSQMPDHAMHADAQRVSKGKRSSANANESTISIDTPASGTPSDTSY